MYTSTEGRAKGSGSLARVRSDVSVRVHAAENIRRLESISDVIIKIVALRDLLAKKFTQNRNSDSLAPHAGVSARARVMASEKLFDIEQEPPRCEKYGPTQFGQQCLIARRLSRLACLREVARAWWEVTARISRRIRDLCLRPRSLKSVLSTI